MKASLSPLWTVTLGGRRVLESAFLFSSTLSRTRRLGGGLSSAGSGQRAQSKEARWGERPGEKLRPWLPEMEKTHEVTGWPPGAHGGDVGAGEPRLLISCSG